MNNAARAAKNSSEHSTPEPTTLHVKQGGAATKTEDAENWTIRQFERGLDARLRALPAGHPVAVFGAGPSGRWVGSIATRYGLRVVAYLDDHPEHCLPELKPRPLSELPGIPVRAVLLATFRNRAQMTKRLHEADFHGAVIAPDTEGNREPAAFSLARSPRDLSGLPGRDWPLNVQIQTQSRCNGKCVMCPYTTSWNRTHPGRMKLKLYRRILDDLEHYRLGKFCLYLQNEPFLDQRWFAWARQAAARLKFARFEVSTNLSALTPRKTDRLIDLLAALPHEVWVSFHGVDRESYERIMGLPFQRALDHLEHFVRGAHAAGINYRVHGFGLPLSERTGNGSLFGKAAYNDFLNRFAAERGLPKIPIRFFKYHDRAGHLRNPDLTFDFRRQDLSGFYCHRIDTWLHVRHDGELLFCCDDYHRETVLGSLAQQTIKDYFRSPEYRSFRDKALGLKDSDPDFICKRCIKPGG